MGVSRGALSELLDTFKPLLLQGAENTANALVWGTRKGPEKIWICVCDRQWGISVCACVFVCVCACDRQTMRKTGRETVMQRERQGVQTGLKGRLSR